MHIYGTGGEKMNWNELANRYENWKTKRKKHSTLQMTDNTELIIECCKGIVSYDDTIIRIRLASHILTIIGDNLLMRNFSSDGVMISGRIKSMEFEG